MKEKTNNVVIEIELQNSTLLNQILNKISPISIDDGYNNGHYYSCKVYKIELNDKSFELIVTRNFYE